MQSIRHLIGTTRDPVRRPLCWSVQMCSVYTAFPARLHLITSFYISFIVCVCVCWARIIQHIHIDIYIQHFSWSAFCDSVICPVIKLLVSHGIDALSWPLGTLYTLFSVPYSAHVIPGTICLTKNAHILCFGKLNTFFLRHWRHNAEAWKLYFFGGKLHNTFQTPSVYYYTIHFAHHISTLLHNTFYTT